jgi:hypothetical protein
MDWLAGSRMHPVDVVLTRSVSFLPVFLLGFAPAALYAYLAFVSFHAVFIHANVRWRWRGLRWLMSTPEYHHWQHASDEEGVDKNFASFLPLWDLLFGAAPASVGGNGRVVAEQQAVFGAQCGHGALRVDLAVGRAQVLAAAQVDLDGGVCLKPGEQHPQLLRWRAALMQRPAIGG